MMGHNTHFKEVTWKIIPKYYCPFYLFLSGALINEMGSAMKGNNLLLEEEILAIRVKSKKKF